mgnify:CR=1 FL=1|tara:strand:+ start:2858 stop:3040 length:183 start_codon:yes stop_codon:yes gene_type:complete
MPKSRHRKNQKKKSKARTEKIKAQQQAMRKDMEKRFAAYMEEMKNRSMNIEEVDDTNKES